MHRTDYTLLYIGVCLILLLAGCKRQTVYNRYLPTALSGWERNDSLVFNIPPVPASGNYVEKMGLRVSRDYPFLSLSLIVEQTNTRTRQLRRDTVECSLFDKRGYSQGSGISLYQYMFPLAEQSLQQDDSLHIVVRHDMKREMLPGISGVGIQIERK